MPVSSRANVLDFPMTYISCRAVGVRPRNPEATACWTRSRILARLPRPASERKIIEAIKSAAASESSDVPGSELDHHELWLSLHKNASPPGGAYASPTM